jgi:cytoskeletal protein CcmA (bactofilin family)
MTIFGPNVTILGDVFVDGVVRVDGRITGNMRCQHLEISLGAIVDGVIVAEAVVVLGSVHGQIYANHLTLRAGSAVNADLCHGTLVLEAGTYFEGKSRRHADPIGMVPIGWPLSDDVAS